MLWRRAVTPTSFPTITKPIVAEMKVKPNLLDYEKFRAGFRWEDVYRELDWLPGGWLNMAHEAIDRHAYGRRRDKVAMIWEGVNGEQERYTFGQLKTLTNKFANVLKSLGIEKGDRVLVFMDRVPELYIAFFGILKVGAIAGTLFSALPDPIGVKDRLKDSGAKVLVTQPDLRRRITGIIPELFDLQHIIVVNKNGRDPYPLDMADLSYEEEMSKASADFEVANTSQYDYSVMHYTRDEGRGTRGEGNPQSLTSRPYAKGVMHRHQAVVQQYATGKWALDLHDNDIYWCTTDPGGVAGTSYGMLAPWTNGVTQVVYEGTGFRVRGSGYGALSPTTPYPVEASAWYEIIQKHKVTVWYTTPTAIRMLMEAGDELPRRYNLSSLRFMASAGEPLDPEAVTWGVKVFGMPFHDTWQQAETGAILCANYASTNVRPGSMGRSIPGVELGVIDDDYNPVGAGVEGNLAVRPGWPSMFHTYWNNTAMYNSRFRKGWYITGDRARMDSDGYFWLAGRAVESTDFTDDTD
jgi:acetyl-CoA synthetase